MRTEFLVPLAWAALGVAVLMALVWAVCLRLDNLGIVDAAWSAGFLPVAVGFALTAHGAPVRRWVVAGMASVWSARLAVHLALRVAAHHPEEDSRYARLRAEWGRRWKRGAFWFFQLQGILLAGLSGVFLVPCLDPRDGLGATECLGVVVWAAAIAGEAIADWQLARFKADPANRGRVCQGGLWRYSRHPNYFFEWLVWVGYFAFAAASPGGGYTMICPLLMLFFLLRVTGIPLTEKLALERKGAAYREYQRTTSPFIPWFRRP